MGNYIAIYKSGKTAEYQAVDDVAAYRIALRIERGAGGDTLKSVTKIGTEGVKDEN